MALEVEHEAEAVQSALEVMEAVLTADCVAREEHAVIIVRQGEYEFRRLLDTHGVLTPPEWLDDARLLDWHRARAATDEPAVQAIEQIIRDARAAGDTVLLCPPDGKRRAVRVGPAGTPGHLAGLGKKVAALRRCWRRCGRYSSLAEWEAQMDRMFDELAALLAAPGQEALIAGHAEHAEEEPEAAVVGVTNGQL